MASRIFYAVVILVAAALSYDIYRLHTLRGALGDVPADYSIGPDDADVSVVEFLDYSCSVCRDIHPVIIQAVLTDGRVRYIPRPLPGYEEGGTDAAVLAYTAGAQGKFMAMHDEIIRNYGALDDAFLKDLVVKIDIDIQRFNEDMTVGKVGHKIIQNGRLFQRIGGISVPTFVINEDFIYVPGDDDFPTVDDFLELFNRAREAQKK